MELWDSQTVDCLKYQLFLRNIRFKEEDKMKGKDYKQYLLGLVQDEIVQGGWSDPVSDEMLNGGVNATTCLAFQTEHLKHHMKLRETQEGSILKRSELLQSNKRQNYQLEMDRLMNELHRPNLPHATTEHMEKIIEELENLKLFNSIII